jgi:hypothetical protein
MNGFHSLTKGTFMKFICFNLIAGFLVVSFVASTKYSKAGEEDLQTLNVTFHTPTGDIFNGNHVASIDLQYNFWANSWKGLVVRGGLGFAIPCSGDINPSGTRSTFDANLAVGYYFTPHDYTPVGDMVWFVSTNLSQPIDNRGTSSNTFVSLTPGFRTHMGDNWYLHDAVEVPVTSPTPYEYQVPGGIMKVY